MPLSGVSSNQAALIPSTPTNEKVRGPRIGGAQTNKSILIRSPTGPKGNIALTRWK